MFEVKSTFRYGIWLSRKQNSIPWIDKDYRYIDFFRQSYNHDDDPVRKEITLHGIRDAEIPMLKKSEASILFQNSDFNINMGVWFNDPDVEMDEIIWYNVLAIHMLIKTADKDLISTNEEFGTASCYAELHR